MKVLFLEESAANNLEVIDPQYPLFVLGGVMMDQNEIRPAPATQLPAYALEDSLRLGFVNH